MCKGKKCLGKNETNKFPITKMTQKKWHYECTSMRFISVCLLYYKFMLKPTMANAWRTFNLYSRAVKKKWRKISIANFKKHWDLFLKGLCHGCLIHFVSYALMPSMRPYSLWDLKKYLWMTKSLLRVKQNLSPKHHINGYKLQKWTLKNC